VPQFAPDAIVVYFNLPGLSDKDLLVTLVSIGVNVPVIVLSGQDTKEDVIQTFRLGAFDYLIWPMREGEFVTAVDRFLNQMRTRREREHLTRQLKETTINELQQRLWVEP
jgi:DNA-binding response OmpR family regulator